MKEAKTTKHILVVDDEKLMLYSLEFLLVQANYEVTLLDSAKEALNVLRQKRENFDLLILDLVLPEFSGIDLIDALKKTNIEIPIIVITGYASPGIESKLNQSNIMGFLNKPFQYDELLEAVREVLNNVKHLNQIKNG